MKRLAAWGCVLAALLASGCDLDYGKDQPVAAEQVPQMVFTGLEQTAIRDQQRLYTMEAERSEVYQLKKEVRLKNFHFQEYDSDGQPASRGSADAAVVNTETNDARLSGRLTARSEQQEVTLEVLGGTAGGLTWNNEAKLLKTLPSTGVTLKKDDGSQITAHALTLDLGANQLELEDGVEGTWTSENKQDADTPLLDQPQPSPPGH